MIELILNGKAIQLEQTVSVKEGLLQWGYHLQAVAMALNEQFVPRTEYECTWLKAGDRVEVVSAMQGG